MDIKINELKEIITLTNGEMESPTFGVYGAARDTLEDLLISISVEIYPYVPNKDNIALIIYLLNHEKEYIQIIEKIQETNLGSPVSTLLNHYKTFDKDIRDDAWRFEKSKLTKHAKDYPQINTDEFINYLTA